MKQGIIFNSDDEVIMTVSEIKELSKSSVKELVQLFQATAIYRDVMKDLIEDHGKAVLSINDEALTDLRISMVESGYNMLAQELVEIFGEDSALLIIADTHNSINLEKHGSVQ
jgi:hypothetical protein